jgi:Protein of unknown function (DUF3137)
MAMRVTTTEQLTREGVDELEPLRFRWLVMTLSFWAIGVVLALVLYAIYNQAGPGNYLFLLISIGVSIAAVFALTVVASQQRKRFELQFDAWRNRAIALLDAAAHFEPDGYLTANYFDSSGLNSKGYNRYSGRNHLTVGKMQASNLSIQYRYTETYYTTVNGRSEQRQREVVVPIFDGMFLVLPAVLPHEGAVVLQPKQTLVKAFLGSNHTDEVPSGLHKINVASPELNNNYVIGVSDQFVGHRVLTPTLMVSLWDYRNQFKQAPRYSYRNNLLFILLKDMSLECGKRPRKWAPVTISKLEQVIRDCHASIEFLKSTSTGLKPT